MVEVKMKNKTNFDITPEEVYEAYKMLGYRELQDDEMRKKECFSCVKFRGDARDEGCWCSAEVCRNKKE